MVYENLVSLRTSSKEYSATSCAEKSIHANLVPQFQRQGSFGRNQSLWKNDVNIAMRGSRFAILAQLSSRKRPGIANKSHKTATIGESQCQKLKGMRKYLVIPQISHAQNCGLAC
jgi:hypothetical protein